MARITVEDCEKIVQNRFDLVVLAAQRARQIFAGDAVTIDGRKDEKKSVISLREIAANTVSVEKLKEKVVDRFRTFAMDEDTEENIDELMKNDTYSPYVSIEMKSAENGDKKNDDSIEDDIDEKNDTLSDNNL